MRTEIMRREEEQQRNMQYYEDNEEDKYRIKEVEYKNEDYNDEENVDDRSNVSNPSLPLRARDRVNHIPILIYGGEAGEDDEEEEKEEEELMDSSSSDDIITTARR